MDPTIYLTAKGGGVPQEERQALTDEQAERLLAAIKGLPPYVFVMLGLYAGLRREEILALQWDCVYLDTEAPYLSVRRAWHTEHNRPVIFSEMKTLKQVTVDGKRKKLMTTPTTFQQRIMELYQVTF